MFPLLLRSLGRLPLDVPRRSSGPRCFHLLGLVALLGACNVTLDAGTNRLPVGPANPVILYQDDWPADWLGEYGALLANDGGPPLIGIVINATKTWGSLSINTSGWKDLVEEATASGLKNIPAVTSSSGAPLTRPANGLIESTTPNRSTGAQLIVDLSQKVATPALPVVVACGTSLTEVADAYLIDPTVVDRVVVIASLGSWSAPRALMVPPNGDLDPWADWIVAHKFRYVQVSAFYDQTQDITDDQVDDLPDNALGMRFKKKRSSLLSVPAAADQVALLVMALPGFATAVERVGPDPSAAFEAGKGPPLDANAFGNAWVVSAIDGRRASERLWRMLLDPHVFGS